MAELRRKTPSTVTLFTAGALEQGRNGWTHQRPEIEAYFAAMMRNGNVYPAVPDRRQLDSGSLRLGAENSNKGIVITASKTPLPVRTTLAQSRTAIEEGAITLLDKNWPQQGGVRGHRRHGAAAGVRGSRGADPARRRRAHRLRGQSAPFVSSDGCFLEHRVASPTASSCGDADFDALFHGDALIASLAGRPRCWSR